MKWSLLELKRYKDDRLTFAETLDLAEALKKRDQEIIAVAPIKVGGSLTVREGEYVLAFTLETVMTLPSTRSLKPVECPFKLDVVEVYMTEAQYAVQQEFIVDEDLVMVLDKELIDLAEAVEDHLLLAIPLQVLSAEEKISNEPIKGQAWELMSEATYFERQTQQEETKIDPRLAKLSALLDNDGASDET